MEAFDEVDTNGGGVLDYLHAALVSPHCRAVHVARCSSVTVALLPR